jgi:F-type H+-transporting ATPase subunit gamma
MATLQDIKRRVSGVKSTQQITRAMKLIAASKLRKAQANILNARPYTDKIASMISRLPDEQAVSLNPFFNQREVKNVAVVIITADRGLAGAFNQNIIKEAYRFIEDELKVYNINYQLYCVGKKGADYFTKRGYEIFGTDTGLFSSLKYDSALNLSEKIISKFIDETFDRVVLIYNTFVSVIRQKIETKQLLPIPVYDDPLKNGLGNKNYIYEPNQMHIFEYLIPKHLKAQVWRALLESNAAELSARMTAMEYATTNAGELIKSLNLTYNKERQSSITKEILEIVSGANALKESS